MKMTPFAKLFVTAIILGVLGYGAWHFRKGRSAATDAVPGGTAAGASAPSPLPGNGATSDLPPAGRPSGPAIERVRSRGVLLVGMDTGEPAWTGTPPMYFPDDKGNPDGFDYALAKRIAAAIGVPEAKIVHGKYSELPGMLREGRFDLLISGYSPTAEPGIAWSEPYLEYGLCLVVPASSKVRTTADLFGKAVGIFDDEAAAEAVRKLVKGYTELIRLEDGYWDQLLSGKFAGFLYDYPYAVAEIAAFYKQNPHRRGSLRIAQYNLTDSSYAVGARASEAELVGEANRALREWRASEDYGTSVKKFLSGGAPIAASPSESGARVVKVEVGDTLSLIARKELGDVARWPEIWEKNKDRFPNPHLISPGDEVVLP